MQQRAILVLEDGRVFHGAALGAIGHTVGEVCFNTSMTGYQEILTDPSYREQIMTFTQPHIGNVGVNRDDMESEHAAVRGCVVRAYARITSNYRAEQDLDGWLREQGVVGIHGVDTRALVRHLRIHGAQRGVIASDSTSIEQAQDMARKWPGLEGRDLVGEASCREEKSWQGGGGYDLAKGCWREAPNARAQVVVLDFGCKRNIFRKLAERGLDLRIVPAWTSAESILEMKPDGVFLSNGPGDPSAVGYAVETIRRLLHERDLPIFGICMGHQLLSLALGLQTFKLKFGHRGGNHPVRDESSGHIEITSQNHGFAVREQSIPEEVEITHRSLFDGTVEGLRLRERPVFSVQYHPESSPGPHDSEALFDRFAEAAQRAAKQRV